MKVIKTPLKGSVIIEPSIFPDERGYFFEGFNEHEFEKMTGIKFNIVQLNFSKSAKGVLRGLHFQDEPKAQAKLVSVIAGEIWDVAVDIRKNSPTYGKWHGEILSSKNKKRFFIPQGFAHGFVALEDNTELMYAVDDFYSKEHDNGIKYNDLTLGIDWRFELENLKISEKDLLLQDLKGN